MSSDRAEVRLGAWSRTGEFLGIAEVPARSGGETPEHRRLPVSGDSGEEETPFTVHRFPGGYRVRIREWWGDGTEMLWLAPLEEGEESFMGLFSEEEVRELLPHLTVFLGTPGGLEVGTSVARESEPEQG